MCDTARIQKEDCLKLKLKFFTTVHTAIFTQAIPRKFSPSSSFIINCKFIQTFLWQMLFEFLFYAREHAKSMNQDYVEQSGSYNGEGRRSSQISRRTYAWVVQSDMEIAKCHSEKWIRRSRRRYHFVFLFSYLGGTKTGNKMKELKGMKNKTL